MFRKFLILALLIGFSSNLSAGWRVNATWKIIRSDGEVQWQKNEFGYGTSKNQALADARSKCLNHATGNKARKKVCRVKTPRATYTPFPTGPYTKSCGKPEVNGNLLTARWCRPVLNKRELDLGACNGDIDHIQNCNGQLQCGECSPTGKKS